MVCHREPHISCKMQLTTPIGEDIVIQTPLEKLALKQLSEIFIMNEPVEMLVLIVCLYLLSLYFAVKCLFIIILELA